VANVVGHLPFLDKAIKEKWRGFFILIYNINNDHAKKSNKKKFFINKRSFMLLPSIEFLKEITRILLLDKINI